MPAAVEEFAKPSHQPDNDGRKHREVVSLNNALTPVAGLLRSRRRTVGRLDTRFTGIDADAAGEVAEYDPSYAVIQGPFTAAVNAYLRTELGFETDALYEVLNADRVRPWSFGEDGESVPMTSSPTIGPSTSGWNVT